METLIGSILMVTLILFAIDLTQTGVTIHKIERLTKRCARAARLSEGKRVREVKGEFRRLWTITQFSELTAGRVMSLKIDLIREGGERMPEETKLTSGEIVTLKVDTELRMSFLPYSLFRSPGPFEAANRPPIEGRKFPYITATTFMVE